MIFERALKLTYAYGNTIVYHSLHLLDLAR